jgi:hypothetical protein
VPASSPILHVFNVVARTLIPLFGIVFLGWSGGKILLVYFADTLGSMYAVSTLAAYAAAQSEPEFQSWIKDGITPLKRVRIVVGMAFIGFIGPLMVAISFGVFLGILLAFQDFAWSEALADRALWISIGCQFLGTVAFMMGQLRWITTLKAPGKLVKARTGLLFARWIAMLLVGVLAIPLPREIYLAVVVLAYAAGTVALELVPERVLTAINAQDLLDALTPRDGAAIATPVESLRARGLAQPPDDPSRAHAEHHSRE